jgi:hypothetical protein
MVVGLGSRGEKTMRTVAVAGFVLLACVLSGAAGATSTKQEVFDVDVAFPIDDVCPFTVEEHQQGSFKETSFYRDDTLVKTIVTNIHGPYVLTWTNLSNGKSVTTHSQTFVGTLRFDAEGNVISATTNGIILHFAVPGIGVLSLDVGHLILVDGEPVFVGGPHDILEGNVGALCDYLADP